MGKVFVFNYNRCNGCRGCQVSCKDEHCDQAWPPYSEAQPIVGQFWMKVSDRERGKVPWVKVTYEHAWCNHCEKCALIEKAPDAVYRRDDGLVGADGAVVAALETDDFGDFKFDQVEPAAYTVRLAAPGKTVEVAADCTAEDLYVGVIDASA